MALGGEGQPMRPPLARWRRHGDSERRGGRPGLECLARPAVRHRAHPRRRRRHAFGSTRQRQREPLRSCARREDQRRRQLRGQRDLPADADRPGQPVGVRLGQRGDEVPDLVDRSGGVDRAIGVYRSLVSRHAHRGIGLERRRVVPCGRTREEQVWIGKIGHVYLAVNALQDAFISGAHNRHLARYCVIQIMMAKSIVFERA